MWRMIGEAWGAMEKLIICWKFGIPAIIPTSTFTYLRPEVGTDGHGNTAEINKSQINPQIL